MSEHEEVRKLIPLAAAGLLDAGELRRVEAEAAVCAACASELESLNAIAGALRDAPPPKVPEGLVARAVTAIRQAEAARAERRWSDVILGFLLLLGWTFSLLLWWVVRVFTGGGVALMGVNLGSPVVWLGATTLVAWLTAGVAAATLAFRPDGMRRSL
ncbi:MAG: hypothetical protein GY953_31465 [bacterium]|nr:hypothetical protein [bacterium]